MTAAERYRATWEGRPLDRLHRAEFYVWQEAIERWKGEGLPDDPSRHDGIFMLDPRVTIGTGLGLGWCEPPFLPAWEETVVGSGDDYEIVRDTAGRRMRVFKGRRHGFMPTYLSHPVAGRKDWEDDVKPRLDPASAGRYAGLDAACAEANAARTRDGRWVVQNLVGGYMYLRALAGPEDLLLMVHDDPGLVRSMMARWAELADRGLAEVQRRVEIDQLSIGEDICYNHGPLISPDMIRSFLLPHYRRVVSAARARQRSPLRFFVDTDGDARPVIPLYLEAGMDGMGPFEVASGCDAPEIGARYPELVMFGGIDKRALAAGPAAIDRHLEHVLPPMRARGRYVPTCDHGVPDNVALADYLHYRRRACELGG